MLIKVQHCCIWFVVYMLLIMDYLIIFLSLKGKIENDRTPLLFAFSCLEAPTVLAPFYLHGSFQIPLYLVPPKAIFAQI